MAGELGKEESEFYSYSDMNKTDLQSKFEWIVIVASIDVRVYFSNSKCIVLLVLMCI